jgi:hypothetical protein
VWREVDQSPLGRRDRDPVTRRRVAGERAAAADENAIETSRAAAARARDGLELPVEGAYSPRRAGADKAQDTPLRSQRRRHPARALLDGQWSDGIHPVVHGDKSPAREPVQDGVVAVPEREQLPPRDASVLPGGQLDQSNVRHYGL